MVQELLDVATVAVDSSTLPDWVGWPVISAEDHRQWRAFGRRVAHQLNVGEVGAGGYLLWPRCAPRALAEGELVFVVPRRIMGLELLLSDVGRLVEVVDGAAGRLAALALAGEVIELVFDDGEVVEVPTTADVVVYPLS